MSELASASVNASVVDLFCGAGGLSHGFHREGFPIAAGLDIDAACRYAYARNNGAPFLQADVSALRAADLRPLFAPAAHRVLVGCAPCQPFSPYNRKRQDPQWSLLEDFGRLIEVWGAAVVSMENVPRLRSFRHGRLFRDFVARLEQAAYEVDSACLFGPAYGLPQTRTRLVLIASRLGPVRLPPPTREPDQYQTVKDTIGTLPRLRAGGSSVADSRSEVSTSLERCPTPVSCWAPAPASAC